MAFRIRGLAAEEFTHLFTLDDDELARLRAVRRVVDAEFAYPCRISLTDAKPGDEVLLVNFEHLPVDSPFRSRHAIYVRRGETRFDAVDVVPEMLRRRLLSLRAFDAAGMLRACDVVEGRAVEGLIETLLADPATAYVHAHFARPGCYAARIDRA